MSLASDGEVSCLVCKDLLQLGKEDSCRFRMQPSGQRMWEGVPPYRTLVCMEDLEGLRGMIAPATFRQRRRWPFTCLFL